MGLRKNEGRAFPPSETRPGIGGGGAPERPGRPSPTAFRPPRRIEPERPAPIGPSRGDGRTPKGPAPPRAKGPDSRRRGVSADRALPRRPHPHRNWPPPRGPRPGSPALHSGSTLQAQRPCSTAGPQGRGGWPSPGLPRPARGPATAPVKAWPTVPRRPAKSPSGPGAYSISGVGIRRNRGLGRRGRTHLGRGGPTIGACWSWNYFGRVGPRPADPPTPGLWFPWFWTLGGRKSGAAWGFLGGNPTGAAFIGRLLTPKKHRSGALK